MAHTQSSSILERSYFGWIYHHTWEFVQFLCVDHFKLYDPSMLNEYVVDSIAPLLKEHAIVVGIEQEEDKALECKEHVLE